MKKSVLLPTDENLILTIREDALDRNTDLNSFCQLLSHSNSMNSIALDGRWGSGKTFFVKQCGLLINAKNSLSNIDKDIAESILKVAKQSNSFEGLTDNKLLAVYFDAWENDSNEDPVLALIYRIVQQLDLKTNGFDLNHLAHILGTIGDAITGRPITSVFECLNERNIFDEIRKHEDLETTIKKFFEEILFEKAERLIVFVDELDRCRPSYAVRLLERIEHYFINNRITFVFSVNLEQLQHTIKNFYGNDFDACRYLDRFFDLRLSLPPINTTKYYNYLNLSNNIVGDRVLMRIQQTFNMSIREFCKFYDLVKVSGMKSNFNNMEDFMFKYVVTLCLALKIINLDLHEEFMHGKNEQPLLDLYDNDFGTHICELLLNDDEMLENPRVDDVVHVYIKKEVKQKEKLSELYNVIFKRNYINEERVRLGQFTFNKITKDFVYKLDSSLNEYTCYDG
mgnify:FL=1